VATNRNTGRQINMDVQRVISYRHFCNKIWNAVRYALPLLESKDDKSVGSASGVSVDLAQLRDGMSLADRWILSRLVRSCAASCVNVTGRYQPVNARRRTWSPR